MSSVEKVIPGRWLYTFGAMLTLIYMLLLAWYCILRWSEICLMAPNNLGDLLAGAFSPLAFAWLVLGFVQQGIELRQNSAALHLQAEELKAAAQHAGAMVELQRKEFDLRIKELEEAQGKAERARRKAEEREAAAAVRKLQPVFYLGLAHRDHARKQFATGSIKNSGPGCTNVSILMETIPGVLQLCGTTEFAEFPSQLKVPLKFFSSDATPRTHPLRIEYTDVGGTSRTAHFVVAVNSSHLEFSAVDE